MGSCVLDDRRRRNRHGGVTKSRKAEQTAGPPANRAPLWWLGNLDPLLALAVNDPSAPFIRSDRPPHHGSIGISFTVGTIGSSMSNAVSLPRNRNICRPRVAFPAFLIEARSKPGPINHAPFYFNWHIAGRADIPDDVPELGLKGGEPSSAAQPSRGDYTVGPSP
jgi:hypothetical protein